jgi:hypothetical protein
MPEMDEGNEDEEEMEEEARAKFASGFEGKDFSLSNVPIVEGVDFIRKSDGTKGAFDDSSSSDDDFNGEDKQKLKEKIE